MSTDFYTPGSSVPNDIATDTRPGYKSFWCCIEKGYTPPPFKMIQDPEKKTIKVVFELSPFSKTCKCSITCTTQALVFDESGPDPTQVGQFCPEDVGFELTLSELIFNEGTPTGLIFGFEDSRGNMSSLVIKSLVTVIPRPPLAVVKTSGTTLNGEVSIPLYSKTFVDLRETVTQIQIERYVGNPANRKLWLDWTDKDRWGRTFWDPALQAGEVYGYRVRFRSAFDDASPWSEWTVLTA